jgi:hypothetical protein
VSDIRPLFDARGRQAGDVALSVVTRFRRPARTEFFWAVGRGERLRLCAELVSAAGRAVIFCRTGPDAIRVASELSRIGVPAATVDHRDFSSSRVRARVVTDDTALSCGRDSTSCVIQFDPATTARRYRRRLDMVASEHATVVSFVVPEREDEARRLLRSLDAPELLTGADVPAVADALASAPVELAPVPEDDVEPAVDGHSLAKAKLVLGAAFDAVKHVPHQASRVGGRVASGVKGLSRSRRPPEEPPQ